MNTPILITDAAAARVKVLLEDETLGTSLRVFVSGGGCSGFSYGFKFDEKMNEGDTEVEHLGIRLLIDPMSFQYLAGSEINYEEGLSGARFTISNPNAKSTCGCGSSFSI